MPRRPCPPTEIGRRIGLLRQFLQLHASTVGRLIGVTGRTVLFWESGGRHPTEEEYAYLKARLLAAGLAGADSLRRFETEVLNIPPTEDYLPRPAPDTKHRRSKDRQPDPVITTHKANHDYHEVGPKRRKARTPRPASYR